MSAKQFPWGFSLLWLVILLVMLWAGFWQLDRAKQKRQLKANSESGLSNKPKNLADWKKLKPFEKVEFSGRYQDLHFALDNQFSDGKVGKFLYSVFETTEGVWLLINRGWVPATTNLDSTSELQRVKGMVATWPEPGYKMGQQPINNVRQQNVTYLEYEPVVKLIKDRLCERSEGKDCIIPHLTIKLAADMPHGFKREWLLPKMTAEKHQAYAIQWFTMSLALCLVYFIFLKKQYAEVSLKSQ